MAGNVIPNRVNVSSPVKIANNDTSGHLGQNVDEQSAAIIIRNSQAQASGHGAISFAFQSQDPTQAINAHGYNLDLHCDQTGRIRFLAGLDYSDGTELMAEFVFSGPNPWLSMNERTTGLSAGLRVKIVGGVGKLFGVDSDGLETQLTP